MGDGFRKSLLPAAILLVLSVLVLAVFLRTGSHPFLSMDDENYLHRNPRIQRGLTWDGAAWAFRSDMDAGWIPLTWLSRMADVSLFGMDAGRHHLVNVLFHLLNTLLLFLVLRGMTGKAWESGTVAALFAVHPLHVESVAWVIERKDVLAGFFWMLALGAYARYAARPGIARYGLVFFFFVLGLMSKPIVVTLPFVLLLLDWWPLCRLSPPAEASGAGDAASFRPASAGRLLLEKVPFIGLSAAVSAVVYLAHRNVGSVPRLDQLPMWARAGNALAAYGSYLRKTVWPSDLAVFYPHPGTDLDLRKAAAAGLFLCAATVLVAAYSRRRRWLATGWFWYLGTLLPVIGLVQAGEQAMADRYTYISLIGVFLAATWEVSGIAEAHPRMRKVLAAAVPAVVLSLAAAAYVQTGYWRDSVALYTRSIAVTERNWKLRYNLGVAYAALGRHEEAIASYREAVRIRPDYADAWYNLGAACVALGRHEEGIASYREALKIQPAKADVWFNLGNALAGLGRFPEAGNAFREAVRIEPNDAKGWNNLGMAYVKLGRLGEARDCFLNAIRLRPDDETARRNLLQYRP